MKKLLFVLPILLSVLHYSYAQQNNAFPLRTKMWNTNSISVCWDNPDASNESERKWVEQAIKNTWEKYSALKFTDWVSASEKNADVHIYINDENPKTEKLGKQIKNMSKGVVLNFTFKNWSPECQTRRESCIKAVAVHEFGHVLGFAHEQNKRECKFDDCLEEPQGEDGDWHMNQCDTSSIMNYCNPAWNNDGLLSKLDIKALQYFYHKPGNQSSFFRGIELVHNSSITNRKNLGTKRINHQVNVFVVGDSASLRDIEKVVYFLDDETFKNPVVVISSMETKFGLGLRVWGEFMLVAIIFNKNGDIQLQKRFLDFNDNESVPLQKGG